MSKHWQLKATKNVQQPLRWSHFTEWMKMLRLIFGPPLDFFFFFFSLTKGPKEDHSYFLHYSNHLLLHYAAVLFLSHTPGIFTASITHCVIKVFHQSSLPSALICFLSRARTPLSYCYFCFLVTFLWLLLPATVEYEPSAAFGHIEKERQRDWQRIDRSQPGKIIYLLFFHPFFFLSHFE